MAAGVHQDRELIEPMQSMVDQTDVGMAKEDHGRMMSTECQVSAVSFYLVIFLFANLNVCLLINLSKKHY